MDVVVPPAGHAAALWSGLMLLLMLILAVLVTRQRQKHNVLIGDDGIDELTRAVRAFGNATEYAPAGVAALALMVVVGVSPLVVHAVGALLFLGRLAHAIGLSRNVGLSIGRLAGTIMTWLAFLIASALLLFYSVP